MSLAFAAVSEVVEEAATTAASFAARLCILFTLLAGLVWVCVAYSILYLLGVRDVAKRKDPGGVADKGTGDSDSSHDHGDTRTDWPPAPPWVQGGCNGGRDGYDAAQDDWLERVAPTLHQFLILQGWGGKQRKPGTIRLMAEEGMWKACLNDNDAGRYAFISGKSLEGLLGSVEKGLREGGLDWRTAKKWK